MVLEKRAKCILMVFLIIAFLNLCACSSNRNNALEDNHESSWESVALLPFSGYICAYEETSTFIQFPIVLSIDKTIALSDVKRMVLVCDNDVEILCNNYRLSAANQNQKKQYQLSTLSFHAKVPEKGEYLVNKLKITLVSGKTVDLHINNIQFSVNIRPNSVNDIEMISLMINQSNLDNIKISYRNISKESIEITGISYSENIYKKINKIEKFDDFNLRIKTNENNLLIQPGEENTFLFEMIPKDNIFQKYENKFQLFLPFLYYRINGEQRYITAQTQATVIQPNMIPDYLSGFLSKNVSGTD